MKLCFANVTKGEHYTTKREKKRWRWSEGGSEAGAGIDEERNRELRFVELGLHVTGHAGGPARGPQHLV